ncbi:MAG: gamma carbonic anhydrase family protein [Candidatus Freyarchaeota archaeon]|nr:gamma carbonic anhydrase family protein [Candidatus Jordarchaeia archaeon]MBS7268096.1 gamma carbonic anhydrase family protein [Candidatus Jordarchaeia archaeon]MBS7279001.1 gamma carbonic anhydrase family protein [Candidatus Jordarchaeia archaeon]
MPLVEFDGKRPKVHPTAFVAPTATIIGDVEIGEKSSVWYGAVIRADFAPVRIGRCTAVEDNCVIHGGRETTIGDEVLIGHAAVVHGCKIGNGAVIGSGATVFTGAEIGEYAVVAMGAVVLENMRVEPKTLVAGIPAKKMRQLNETEKQALTMGSKIYAELAQKYKQQRLE